MGRHTDLDGNGVADYAERAEDQRDEWAHDDEACDSDQQHPDRWTGVQRDPDQLPVTPVTDELGGPLHG